LSSHNAKPNRVEQEACSEILFWKQDYPAIILGFTLLQEKMVIIKYQGPEVLDNIEDKGVDWRQLATVDFTLCVW
jgi:hypothetical protein